VRLDDAVMALLAAVRVALIGIADRTGSQPPQALVSELYTDQELAFRQAFRVTVSDAQQRWANGQQELARSTVLLGVAALDELLGSTISLLRRAGHDHTTAGDVDTGVSAKLRHLCEQGGLALSHSSVELHDLLLAARHSITHHGGQPRVVRQVWTRLEQAQRDWWIEAAGRPLPLARDQDELVMADGEVLATFKTLDRIAMDVNASLRMRLSEHEWAALAAAEYRVLAPTKAGDPSRNVAAVMKHADNVWRVKLDQDTVARVLSRR
jgi:hypothetical protein